MPRLNALYRRYRDQGLVIVGLNADTRRESAREVARREIDFPCLFDAGGSQADYGVVAYPTTVLADRLGRLRGQFTGKPGGGMADLERRVEALLAER